MRVSPARLLAFLAVAAVGVVACADSTAPASHAFTGTFVLRSFDGAPVPALQFDYGSTRQYLTADTLTADGQGRYTRVILTRTDSVGRAYSAAQRLAYAGAYAVRGDTVDFPAQCGFGATCINMPVGWRMADGSLVLAYRSTRGFQAVSRFARVR